MYDFYSNKNYKNVKVRKFDKREIQPEEIFLDKLTERKRKGVDVSERKLEVPVSRRCFYGLLTFSILIFFTLFLRSFQLQIINGEEFFKKAERNKFAYSSIQASRGVIYDKNLNQLVFNQPIFNLFVINSDINKNELEKYFNEIKDSIDLDYLEFESKIKESESEDILIKNNLNHESLISLEIITRNLPGLEIRKDIVRNYLDGESFSHVIGYIGKISPEEMETYQGNYSINDYIGKSGLEKSYEEVMKVVPGRVRSEKDVFGNLKSEELISMAQSGKSLVLSIDGDLQKKIYSVLEEKIPEIGSKNAAVIATNPETGEILSLISYPGFDNNVFSIGDSIEIQKFFVDEKKPLFNRIVSAVYPVGSTIKPLMGIAALEEKIVSPQNEFYSSGGITIPNPWNPSNPSFFADNKVHGWVNLRKAIAVSSNVYFYIIGGGYEGQKGMGPDIMKKYLNLFGWGEKTGIDLPDEKNGFIPEPKWKQEFKKDEWRIGDSYNLSIGQGDVLITPLQVSNAFNVIANRGKMMKPIIVKKIIDQEKNVVQTIEPEIIKDNFVSLSSIEEVRKGMRDAVLYGSAVTLNDLPVEVAAKTGTAQIPKSGHYHNWVTLFAPYDKPEIALTVIIEEVKSVRAAALPVAKEILQWYFQK
jgi:penicillin-binding protein 2